MFRNMFSNLNFAKLGILIVLLLSMFMIVPVLNFTKSKNEAMQAVIFNCDGVLVQNDFLKFLAWQKALAKYNIPFTMHDYMTFTLQHPENFLQQFCLSKNRTLPNEQVEKEKELIYLSLLEYQTPKIMPGILVAKQMAANKERLKIRLVLVSADSKHETLLCLKAADLLDTFDIILTKEDLGLQENAIANDINTTHKLLYQKVLAELKFPSALCLVIDSHEKGVTNARDLGMTVIAVPSQFTRHQNFSLAHEVMNNLLYLDYKAYFKKSPR